MTTDPVKTLVTTDPVKASSPYQKLGFAPRDSHSEADPVLLQNMCAVTCVIVTLSDGLWYNRMTWCGRLLHKYGVELTQGDVGALQKKNGPHIVFCAIDAVLKSRWTWLDSHRQSSSYVLHFWIQCHSHTRVLRISNAQHTTYNNHSGGDSEADIFCRPTEHP